MFHYAHQGSILNLGLSKETQCSLELHTLPSSILGFHEETGFPWSSLAFRRVAWSSLMVLTWTLIVPLKISLVPWCSSVFHSVSQGSITNPTVPEKKKTFYSAEDSECISKIRLKLEQNIQYLCFIIYHKQYTCTFYIFVHVVHKIIYAKTTYHKWIVKKIPYTSSSCEKKLNCKLINKFACL